MPLSYSSTPATTPNKLVNAIWALCVCFSKLAVIHLQGDCHAVYDCNRILQLL